MSVYMFARLLGEVRFDHQYCISKEIKEKQPFPPQFKGIFISGMKREGDRSKGQPLLKGFSLLFLPRFPPFSPKGCLKGLSTQMPLGPHWFQCFAPFSVTTCPNVVQSSYL
ncbi:hypothetical protein YC2023_062097 [Brassica napus]